MIKKGKITLLILVPLILVLIFVEIKLINGSTKTNGKESDVLPENASVDLTQINFGGKNLMADAIYIDGCKTIDELVQNADVIVKGKAGEIISERLAGVLISFEVEDVAKSEVEIGSSLTIIQIKDSNQLKTGETYVLALGEDNDESTYHVIGGYQGIFSAIDEKIYNKDEKLKIEIQQALSDNIVSSITDENASANSPLDKLSNYFSGLVKPSLSYDGS